MKKAYACVRQFILQTKIQVRISMYLISAELFATRHYDGKFPSILDTSCTVQWTLVLRNSKLLTSTGISGAKSWVPGKNTELPPLTLSATDDGGDV